MKFAVTVALLVGLLIATDVAYLGTTRSRGTLDRYLSDFQRKQETAVESQAKRSAMWMLRNLPDEMREKLKQTLPGVSLPGAFTEDERTAQAAENKTIQEARALLGTTRRDLEYLQIASFLSLGFLGCVLIWLALLTAVRKAAERGTPPFSALKGSIIGAAVIGTALTCAYGFAFWSERLRTYDRLEWECAGWSERLQARSSGRYSHWPRGPSGTEGGGKRPHRETPERVPTYSRFLMQKKRSPKAALRWLLEGSGKCISWLPRPARMSLAAPVPRGLEGSGGLRSHTLSAPRS